jgi:hypothetical protein
MAFCFGCCKRASCCLRYLLRSETGLQLERPDAVKQLGKLLVARLQWDTSMQLMPRSVVYLVAICLSVDVAKDHRVLWVVVDTAEVAYVCLFNGWFRNHLVGFAIYLSKREER